MQVNDKVSSDEELCGLVISYGVGHLVQYLWIDSEPTQICGLAHLTLIKWNFHQNANIYIQETVCQMVPILFRPQWVNQMYISKKYAHSSMLLINL